MGHDSVRERLLARLREVGVRVADVSVGHEGQPETWQVHFAHLHPTAHEQHAAAIVLRDIANPPKARVSVPPLDTVSKPATLPVSLPSMSVRKQPKPARRRSTPRPPPRQKKRR